MLLRCPAAPCRASASALTPRASRPPFRSTSPHLSLLALHNRRRFYSAEAVNHSHDVAILGGGITGLASAYYLLQRHPNAKVTLYEASERIGGWLDSTRVPVQGGSVLFEAGPRTLRPAGNGLIAAKLMQELDLAKDAIFTQTSAPAAQNRFVYYPDHLVCMPHPSQGLANILWTILNEPIFENLAWSGLREIWRKPRDEGIADESIGEFFSRRYSRHMVERVLSAVIHGIYAGDVWQLSARSLFPRQWRAEADSGSITLAGIRSMVDGVMEMTPRDANFQKEMRTYAFDMFDPLFGATIKTNSVFTFRDGLKMLPDRMYAKLFETGRVEFKTSTPVTAIAPAEGNTGITVSSPSQEDRTHSHAISALAPWQLNALSAEKQLIPSVPSVTVMTVNLYFRTPNLHPPGFGYLIPMATPFENNPERALGVVFDDAYSPGPQDLDTSNWHDISAERLKEEHAAGRPVYVNGFAWHNMPQNPNMQDHVQSRGTKVTVMLGGHWWNDWPVFPDEQEGLALARAVLERHLNIKEEPEAWKVNLQKDCIPQYTVGHERRLQQAHNNIWNQYKGRLRVVGNWMSGVGVNDCIRSAWEVARAFNQDGTGLEHIGQKATVKMTDRPGKMVQRDDKDS